MSSLASTPHLLLPSSWTEQLRPLLEDGIDLLGGEVRLRQFAPDAALAGDGAHHGTRVAGALDVPATGRGGGLDHVAVLGSVANVTHYLGSVSLSRISLMHSSGSLFTRPVSTLQLGVARSCLYFTWMRKK